MGSTGRKRPVFTGAPTPSATRRRTGSGPVPTARPSAAPSRRDDGGRGRSASSHAGGRLGLGLGRQLQGKSNVVGRSSSVPSGGRRAEGRILNYDTNKGYGFIQSPDVAGDVYFQKRELPQLVQNKPGHLQDKRVTFEVVMTPDGKPRGNRIVILNPAGTGVSATRRERGSRGGRNKREQEQEGPLPPLSDDALDAMTRYLEENGGSADFGKFCREFKAVKKAQLEKHFLLEFEDKSSGKATISIGDPILREMDETGEIGEDGASGANIETIDGADGEPPKEDEWLGRFTGVVHALHDNRGGYGFIKSEEVQEGDCYFKKEDLPEEAKHLKRTVLVGQQVEFDATLSKDRKPRAENITFLNELPLPGEEPAASIKSDDKATDAAPLSLEMLQDMTGFLMDNGGCMDYGRFANRFSGVKKQQLLNHEEELVLVQQDAKAGGRWKIAVPGCEHLVPEETTPAREKPSSNDKKKQQAPKSFQPSEGLWLTGVVTKWDQHKQFGFLQVDGAPDVFLHRDVLPEEVASVRNLQGVEFAFEVTTTDEGKPRAKLAKPLLMPDGAGGWRLRHVATGVGGGGGRSK